MPLGAARMTEPQRIGVYGGTFNPPHRAHLEIARQALSHLALDEVIFVVAAVPPHKQGEVYVGPEDRLAMVEALVAEEPRMCVSRMELEREGPSYTVDTLAAFHGLHPDSKLYFIVGGDSLLDLPRWRDPEGILALADIVVARRPGIPDTIPPLLQGHCHVLPCHAPDISSTNIRHQLVQGGDTGDALPRAVQRVICERGLYHACC